MCCAPGAASWTSAPDASPIIGLSPVDNLYLNCGWGTGGFKATPGVGWVYAHTIAHDTPHALNAPFSLDRFTTGALVDEHGAAAVAHWGAQPCCSSPAPWCGPRDEAEFHYGGQAHVPYPDDPSALTDQEWARYLFFRDNPKGPFAERWSHAAGCRKWFNAVRDTATTRSWRCTGRVGTPGDA